MSDCTPPPTVILIDDDPFEHQAFGRAIKQCKLLEPIGTFSEPRAALDFMCDPQNAKVDVIFLDLQMPTMSGFEFLDKAMASMASKFKEKTVIILSSSDSRQDIDRSKCYDTVKMYFNKPLTADGIRQVVENWNRKSCLPSEVLPEE